ncbi:hypothetical protein EVAR_52179_1 [Eumeta japonica]|uniref:Uncharacterized protein n=1 Tax=Eumeta variegata TaxID=151549 RepID=A0A4C1Y8W3_EUMVA|nr:hypothetical protein EVAR_52179_1 [Eumeta japonica]
MESKFVLTLESESGVESRFNKGESLYQDSFSTWVQPQAKSSIRKLYEMKCCSLVGQMMLLLAVPMTVICERLGRFGNFFFQMFVIVWMRLLEKIKLEKLPRKFEIREKL